MVDISHRHIPNIKLLVQKTWPGLRLQPHVHQPCHICSIINTCTSILSNPTHHPSLFSTRYYPHIPQESVFLLIQEEWTHPWHRKVLPTTYRASRSGLCISWWGIWSAWARAYLGTWQHGYINVDDVKTKLFIYLIMGRLGHKIMLQDLRASTTKVYFH